MRLICSLFSVLLVCGCFTISNAAPRPFPTNRPFQESSSSSSSSISSFQLALQADEVPAAHSSASIIPKTDESTAETAVAASDICTTSFLSGENIKSSICKTKKLLLNIIVEHKESLHVEQEGKIENSGGDWLVKRLEEAVTFIDELHDHDLAELQVALNDIITCSICLDKFTKDTTFVSNCCHMFHERCMQDHIVATDRVPGFAKCPLCRGDIEGDALTFVKKKNGHYIAFSQARLVDRIVDLLSSETSKEQKTLKINTDIDVSKSVRTKWISRSQIEIDHQLHPHRRQRLEYAYFCLVFVGGFLNGVLFENDGLRLIWILALFIPVLLKLLKTATAVFIFLLVLIPQFDWEKFNEELFGTPSHY